MSDFITVIETKEFLKQAELFLNDKDAFISFIANNPLSGDLIQGTGGVRKIRWLSKDNKGKSGGARVIYYYHNNNIPLFLFTVYKKNQKVNLSEKEKKKLKQIIAEIIKAYKKS